MNHLGVEGEQKALDFFDRNGYLLLEKNYRSPFGEIDLIVVKDGKVSFIEVKTRSGFSKGYPCESVTPKKLRNIKNTANYYLRMHPDCGIQAEIGVIEIYKKKSAWYIKYLENVWLG